MKLDEFRRKAHKGILPDHKVEKTHFNEKCICGGTFGLVMVECDKRVFTCNRCAAKVVFYVCTTYGCNNIVEGERILCKECVKTFLDNYDWTKHIEV